MARTKGKPNLTPRQRAEIAKELSEGASVVSIQRKYGITESAVYYTMRKYGIGRRNWLRWTPEEDEILRTWYPSRGASWDGWAKLMPDRKPSASSIHNRAWRLGVKRYS